MSLVSKRLLSSQGRVQELWRSCFHFPRSHALAGTIIGSQRGAALPSMETFPVVTGSGFPCLSPEGRNFRAFSSLPSSSGENEKYRTTQTTGQADSTFSRNILSGGRSFLPNDASKPKDLVAWMNWKPGSKAWDPTCLSSPKMTQIKSGMSTVAGNDNRDMQRGSNFDPLKKQGDAMPARVRFLNTAFLLPLMVVYNKISSIFLLNLSLIGHINQGVGEIMADYVHQEMTRHLIMICLRLFLLIAMKDVFLSVAF